MRAKHSYYGLQSVPALLRFQVLEKIALRKNLEVKFTLVNIVLVGDLQHHSFMNLKSDSITVDQKCVRTKVKQYLFQIYSV